MPFKLTKEEPCVIIPEKEMINMVKHVIIWNLKEEFSPDEKARIKAEMKESLEALMGKIPGLLDIKVYTDPLASSNGEVLLDTTFTDEEALKGYAVHPIHVEAANTKVRPFTASRSCMDFEI